MTAHLSNGTPSPHLIKRIKWDVSCKFRGPVPDLSNRCKYRIDYYLACSGFLSCVVTKVGEIRNPSEKPQPSQSFFCSITPSCFFLHLPLHLKRKVASEGKVQLTLTRTQGEMAFVFARRKSSLFRYYIQLGSFWLSNPIRCSDCYVLGCGTSQEGLLSSFWWRQLPWRWEQAQDMRRPRTRAWWKPSSSRRPLPPLGGTLWDKLGGRIVNKVAQIYKCSPFYLTCFVLLLGSKNPQKCPFVQLPSRAHEGTSPADSSFGHVGCPLWPRRVAFKSLIWRLVYTKSQIATSQRSESFYHSLY